MAFDTGNPVGSDRRIGTPLYRKQSSWEFYQNVREFIDHVHIKDCIFIAESGGLFPDLKHTFPGEGHGDVRQILTDLLARGYPGVLSIEPHLAAVQHNANVASAENMYFSNNVEYGQRLKKLVDEIVNHY